MGKSIDSGIRQAWIHIPSLQLISNVNLASHVTLLILFFLSVRWEYSGCLVGFLWELNEIHSYKDLKSGPVVAVQSLGCVQLFVAPWTVALQATLSITNFRSLLKLHQVSDAIQPSHPLSSPSPAFNLSQHQGLFKWVSSSHQVAKLLEFLLQHQSFQWIFRTDFL